MLLYKHWFIKLKPYVLQTTYPPKTSFTILIPARNESENIGMLLQSIIQQNYPIDLWEVIVIDDFSTDATTKIVHQIANLYPNIQLVELSKVLQGEQLNS